MAETLAFKYRAFISYSHADAAWAKWLHRALEGFRIDHDLVGRETETGTIPKTLRPVFRDRDDFTAGDSLADQTREALDASAALIVLCSPKAAKSDYVTEEIRLFKSRHPERPVIPLMMDGTPGDPDAECFPPSLRFRLDEDGKITDEPVEVLAADAREEGDGKDLALAKVVAGLLGVSSDDIFRRAMRERRRWARIRNGIVAAIFVLCAAGGYAFWDASQKADVIAQKDDEIARKEQEESKALKIAREMLGAKPADAATPGQEQSLVQALIAIQENAEKGDADYTEAFELLEAGKGAEALPLLIAAADKKKQQAAADFKRENEDAAKAYREAAAIAEAAKPWQARSLYAQAAALDPDHIEGLYQHGRFQLGAGLLSDAENAFRQVVGLTKPGNETWVYWARLGIGDIRVARGELSAAKADYRSAGEVAERLAEADPDSADWQRDLAVAYSKVGNIALSQGDLPAALKAHSDSLNIAIRLADTDPDNAGWQRDLTASHSKVGDVLVAKGDLSGALKAYRDSLSIALQLAAADPDHAEWQRGLSVSYEKVGDVALAEGDFAAAFKAYSDGLGIAMPLAAKDPENAIWQRGLSVSYNKVGDVAKAQGDLTAALKAYEDGLGIRKRLAEADPGNAGWQRELSVSYERVGDVAKAQGDLAGALKAYSDSLGIDMRLTQADPDNTDLQRNLSVSYTNVGDVLLAQGDLPGALKAYRDGLGIAMRLAATDPNNAQWQRDLLVAHQKLGDVAKVQGDLAAARQAYADSLIIAERLAKADPDNAGWQRDLSVANQNVGNVLWRQDDAAGALKAFSDSLAIAKKLVARDASNAHWQADLDYVVDHIGALVYALVVDGGFRQALEAADEAIAVAPDRIWIHGNRAHALMFSGRADEARAIYLRYRGQDNVLDDRSWKTLVTDDFVELRKVGHEHALMDEIVAAFDKKDENPTTDLPAQAAP